jgi:hypothetical protein
MNLEKLEAIFIKRYDELKKKDADDDFWVDYCDRHKIKIMHAEWVKECFNEENEGVVCIFSPENEYWLLVPKRMAERVLVLGYLP